MYAGCCRVQTDTGRPTAGQWPLLRRPRPWKQTSSPVSQKSSLMVRIGLYKHYILTSLTMSAAGGWPGTFPLATKLRLTLCAFRSSCFCCGVSPLDLTIPHLPNWLTPVKRHAVCFGLTWQYSCLEAALCSLQRDRMSSGLAGDELSRPKRSLSCSFQVWKLKTLITYLGPLISTADRLSIFIYARILLLTIEALLIPRGRYLLV